jgi:hypothetical protein
MSPLNRAVTVSNANVTAVNFTANAQTWSISGTISPAASGAGATVTLTGAASAAVTADASGHYSITGLSNGSYTVTPTKTGFTFVAPSQSVTLSGANIANVNFTAQAVPNTWSISGTISPAANGSGAIVTLSGAANAVVTADISGNYSFNGLSNGSYTVTPSKTGFTFTPTNRAVTVSGANVSAVNFTAQAVQSTWSISGTISPAASGSGATVVLSGTASATTSADASGNYTFTGLANGAYTVTPSKIGFTFNPASQPATINSANVSAINFTASSAGPAPTMSLDHTNLNFGTNGTVITSSQTVTVDFSPASLTAWTATSNQPNIVVTPSSGTGSAQLQIAANPGPSGVVTVTAVGATNSPQQIQVRINNVTPALPFGSFDTPADRTTGVSGAIAVTGWALDNIEITDVGIWRDPIGNEPTNANGLVFLGHATLVPGARPDVEAAFPTEPWNHRAGWGYMLLTNFLPNPGGQMGNGVINIHAIAENRVGYLLDMGVHSITVDNAHANKPFGSIDTPDQGGTASGDAFVNFGWALTQNPFMIPTDGSTITVTVDGVMLGHPVYNQFRADIANSFPGLANSNGAVGFFYIDTTKLTNGMHTIGWLVYDNGTRGDGIGSRFFNVFNGGAGASAAPEQPVAAPAEESESPQQSKVETESVVQDRHHSIEIEELGRVELPLGATSGHLLVGGKSTRLPIGSTLSNGVFYWQLGAGFLGEYRFVFERSSGAHDWVTVRVQPKSALRSTAAQ